MIYAPTVRQWSDRVFAAFVPDGCLGRYVGYGTTREEAEELVQLWLDSGWVARRVSPSGGSAHHAQTAGRHDPEG